MTLEQVTSLILKQYHKEKVRFKKPGSLFLHICKNKYSIWGFLIYKEYSAFLSDVSALVASYKEVEDETKTCISKKIKKLNETKVPTLFQGL